MNGFDYRAVEWTGEAIGALSMEGRFTIANMGVEMGAKAFLFEADAETHAWVRARTEAPYEAVSPDPDAAYAGRMAFDVSALPPLLATPGRVDAVEEVARHKGRKVTYAFLGTCTNSRVSDWEVAARILRGRRVAPGVRFHAFPGSMEVFREAGRRGLAQVFLEAGVFLHNPGCGPCSGATNGVPAGDDVVISSANRNFVGRMGNPGAEIYLASPATVAASAVTGEITDPREFL